MKNTTKKVLAIALAVVLLVGVVIGGTMAWFTDKTQVIENTFTVGNIDIELEETDSDKDQDPDKNAYKMIPGWTIEKDPVATVKANSEDCYLFVKLDKSANFDSFMTYAMADEWEALAGETGVYYRIVATNPADQKFPVIKDNTVTVKDTVTKGDMDALTATTYPKLNVTAYAVQLWKENKGPETAKFTPAEAWAIAKPNT